MSFNDLTQEEKELILTKTPEEILALAKERGRKLSDDELEFISGGGERVPGDGDRWGSVVRCTECGNGWDSGSTEHAEFTCPNCGHVFFV